MMLEDNCPHGDSNAVAAMLTLWRPMIAAGCAMAMGMVARASYAADFSPLNTPATVAPADKTASGSFIDSWLAMVTATQAAQPHWMTPLVTVTPRLEQEVRFDENIMNQGNGAHILNVGGGKGIEVIPTYDTELIFGMPAYDDITTAKGANPTGWADYPALLLKYRLLSANEQQGNYIVTAFLQTSVPTGFNTVSNDVYVVQPTLAFGMGWGDFDFQATVSQQYAVSTIGPPGSLQAFGNPFLANVAFQYHLFQYFWPELEVNYTYWPSGTHADLNQVLLTAGLILGRFPLGGRSNLNIGAGYQFAVTNNPITNNNWVMTARVTF